MSDPTPTGPTARNRLSEAASPYLRQHADNPVNWQPWDEAALTAARERDVPLFVSIGYSACHWCHVMEEESFADESIAAVLNEGFVPIKVDREERPDVDDVYMTVCRLVTGGGGWPLSAWCTPDGKPFYVGTYFPPEPGRGRPGFKQLCERIAASWSDPEERAEMEDRAEQWTAAAREELESVPGRVAGSGDDSGSPGGDGSPDADVDPGAVAGEAFESGVAAALRAFDAEHGGFGTGGPKFPQPARLELLLRAAARGDDDARRAATATLDAMAAGGVCDQVGGGFHRYATDRSWTVPHFEKMLYDNATLPTVYLDACRLTGGPRYASVATETLAFLDRELRDDAGGFYSTLDARSVPPASRRGDGGEDPDPDPGPDPDRAPDPVEGAFYTWTPAEVDAVLDEPAATLVRERYGITAGGNFEDGTTVLTASATVGELADSSGLSPERVREELMDARVALYEAREERPRPARDEKLLAGWNGLAITAFARAGRVLSPAVADGASRALWTVRDRLWDGDALARRYIDGDVLAPGYLDDYAFLGRGAFETYQATGDPEALGFALDLADGIVADYYDADDGTIYAAPTDATGLIARPQEPTDRSLPSSLGTATRLLLALDGFAPATDYRSVAETVLATHADRIRASPLEHVSLALAADRAADGGSELTVAADGMPDDWWETLASRYLPGTVLAPRPPTAEGLDAWLDDLGMAEPPPVWRDRDAVDGEPTAYACRGFTCSPPRTDLRAALDWLADEPGE